MEFGMTGYIFLVSFVSYLLGYITKCIDGKLDERDKRREMKRWGGAEEDKKPQQEPLQRRRG